MFDYVQFILVKGSTIGIQARKVGKMNDAEAKFSSSLQCPQRVMISHVETH